MATSRTRKAPKAKKEDAPFSSLYDQMKQFLKIKKDEFALISSNEEHNYFALVRKTELTTKSINKNNPFQPYESESTNIYPVVFIIWFANSDATTVDFIYEMKKFNAKIVKLPPSNNYIKKLCTFVENNK